MRRDYVNVQLIGGIGNQLFQWATAYSVSLERHWLLNVDESFVLSKKSRLSNLGITCKELPKMHLLPKFVKGSEFQRKYLNRVLHSMVYESEEFCVDEKVINIAPNQTLRGYFQSEMYFSAHKEMIRDTVLNGLSLHRSHLDLHRMFEENRIISVHIRRGDYLQLKETFGLLDREYYTKVLEYLGNVMRGCKIVVFSDSISLARELVPNADLFIGIEVSDLESMELMRKSKILIGANSSFSWWSGYLMSEKSTRIFPQPWFKKSPLNTSNLLPSDWERFNATFE